MTISGIACWLLVFVALWLSYLWRNQKKEADRYRRIVAALEESQKILRSETGTLRRRCKEQEKDRVNLVDELVVARGFVERMREIVNEQSGEDGREGA